MPCERIAAKKTVMRKAAKLTRQRAWQQQGKQVGHTFAKLGIGFAGIAAPAIVSGYVPIGEEADISELMVALHGQGYDLALPVMLGNGRPLEFRAWAPGDQLDEVQWRMREPRSEAKVVRPDIVLSPLLAFDSAGYRLGYGGGFYDRSLAELQALKPVVSIGVAFDEQKVDCVPRDSYDQPLDWILTPSGAQRFSGR